MCCFLVVSTGQVCWEGEAGSSCVFFFIGEIINFLRIGTQILISSHPLIVSGLILKTNYVLTNTCLIMGKRSISMCLSNNIVRKAHIKFTCACFSNYFQNHITKSWFGCTWQKTQKNNDLNKRRLFLSPCKRRVEVESRVEWDSTGQEPSLLFSCYMQYFFARSTHSLQWLFELQPYMHISGSRKERAEEEKQRGSCQLSSS